MTITPAQFETLFDARESAAAQESFAAFGAAHPLVRPIFVLGLNRSGTSIFTRLLGRTDALVNWSEANEMWDPVGYPWEADKVPRAFWPFEPRRYTEQILADNGGVDGPYYSAVPGLCAMHVHAHRRHADARFLNKSPMNTLRVDLLERLFPDACYVSLVRDPRAVIRSWAEKTIPKLAHHPRSGIDDSAERLTYIVNGEPVPRLDFLDRLCDSYDVVVSEQLRRVAALPEARRFEARYETFVEDIHGTIRALDAHFGLDPASRRWDEIPESQMSRNRKFREEFDPREMELVVGRCRELMQRLGYRSEAGADR